MLDFVSNLSKGTPHVKANLYNTKKMKIYFTILYFHNSGFVPFHPKNW